MQFSNSVSITVMCFPYLMLLWQQILKLYYQWCVWISKYTIISLVLPQSMITPSLSFSNDVARKWHYMLSLNPLLFPPSNVCLGGCCVSFPLTTDAVLTFPFTLVFFFSKYHLPICALAQNLVIPLNQCITLFCSQSIYASYDAQNKQQLLL
jgi:hypothetical protein